ILHIEINEIICLENHSNRLDDHGGVEGEVVGDPFGGRIFPRRGSPGRQQHVTIDVRRKPSARSLG
ncbi:MAG: hypothetical protein ACERK9_14025, partial [Deltaproteobacteria bacterium]